MELLKLKNSSEVGKISLDGFDTRLGTAENKISELEETAIKTIKNKAQTKKNKTE